jgi:hypothetical protein
VKRIIDAKIKLLSLDKMTLTARGVIGVITIHKARAACILLKIHASGSGGHTRPKGS